MTKLTLQIRIVIAIMISGLDPFEVIRWVSIGCSDGTASTVAVNRGAAVLAQTALALAWEGVCCALPNATDARVEMTVETITHNVNYDKVIIKPDCVYTEWSPTLSKLMKTFGDQIEKDMATILTDIAEAPFCDNDVEEEEPHYELRKRD